MKVGTDGKVTTRSITVGNVFQRYEKGDHNFKNKQCDESLLVCSHLKTEQKSSCCIGGHFDNNEISDHTR